VLILLDLLGKLDDALIDEQRQDWSEESRSMFFFSLYTVSFFMKCEAISILSISRMYSIRALSNIEKHNAVILDSHGRPVSGKKNLIALMYAACLGCPLSGFASSSSGSYVCACWWSPMEHQNPPMHLRPPICTLCERANAHMASLALCFNSNDVQFTSLSVPRHQNAQQ
jgi:hypothetical protein